MSCGASYLAINPVQLSEPDVLSRPLYSLLGIAVSWRRSAPELVTLAGAGTSARPGPTLLARTLVPHSEQKRSSGSTACPQFGQARGRALPHLLQNLLPSTTLTLQPGHCKGPHLLAYFAH